MIDVLVVGGIFREILNGDTLPSPRYGGSGLVAAIAAASLGAEVALASYLGEEDEVAVRDELRAAHVNDSWVQTLSGGSGTFVFPTHQNPELPWPMYRPAEDLPQTLPLQLPAAQIDVAFGIPDYDPIAAGWLTGRKTTLIWDRQGWLSRARSSVQAARLPYRRKVYLANEKEAEEETGIEGVEDLLRRLPPNGFETAVLKRGGQGVIVVARTVGVGGNAMSEIPSFKVNTALTIGSGDVFAGAFSARLAFGDGAETAAVWGCAAAAVALSMGSNILGADARSTISDLVSTNVRNE